MTEALKRVGRSGTSASSAMQPQLHGPIPNAAGRGIAPSTIATAAAQPRRLPGPIYTGSRDLFHALDAILRYPQAMASEPAILALASPTFDPSTPSGRDWDAICALLRGAAAPFDHDRWYTLKLYMGVWHQSPTVPVLFWSNASAFLAAADNLAQFSGVRYTATQIARETHALRVQLSEQGRFVGHLSLKVGANLDPSIHIDDLPVRHEYRDNLAYSDTQACVFFPSSLGQITPAVSEPQMVSRTRPTSMPAPPRAKKAGVETLPVPMAQRRDSSWSAHETMHNEAEILAQFDRSAFANRESQPPALPKPSHFQPQGPSLRPTLPPIQSQPQGVMSPTSPTVHRHGQANHERRRSSANYHPYAHPEASARAAGRHHSRSGNRISAPPGTLNFPRPHNDEAVNGTSHRNASAPNIPPQRQGGNAGHVPPESSGLVDRLSTLKLPSVQSPTVPSFTSQGFITGPPPARLWPITRIDSPVTGPSSNITTPTSSPALAHSQPPSSTAGASGSRFAPRWAVDRAPNNLSAPRRPPTLERPSEPTYPPVMGVKREPTSPLREEDELRHVDQNIKIESIKREPLDQTDRNDQNIQFIKREPLGQTDTTDQNMRTIKREPPGQTDTNDQNIPPRESEYRYSKKPDVQKGWGRLQR